MHVHLPKPLHGWREFVGEVGIIVIGVLLALGAEQIIETLHWRHKAGEATEALREEIGAHYNMATEAVVAAPCIDRQLAALEDRLLTANGAPSPAPTFRDLTGEFTFRAPSRPWSDDVWQSVVSEGVSSHLRKTLRALLADHYIQVAIMRQTTATRTSTAGG